MTVPQQIRESHVPGIIPVYREHPGGAAFGFRDAARRPYSQMPMKAPIIRATPRAGRY